MHTTLFRCCSVLVLAALCGAADPPPRVVEVVSQGHAHNDYEHPRPLFDALDHGFRSVEADIFLVDGRLLVGHAKADLKPERTLEKLYLDPLRERAVAHREPFAANHPAVFFLLIDVKTDAKPTYAALHAVLTRYAEMLTEVNGGNVQPRAVTVVVSGNCDRETIAKQPRRFAAIDGRPPDLDSDAPNHLIPWISDRWGSHFKWTGDGPMADAERQKLREFAAKAGKHKRMVRFWGTPENRTVWQELRDAGVDLINTDKLAELQEFLRSPARKLER
jgi:hypothetical protein